MDSGASISPDATQFLWPALPSALHSFRLSKPFLNEPAISFHEQLFAFASAYLSLERSCHQSGSLVLVLNLTTRAIPHLLWLRFLGFEAVRENST